MINKYAEIQDRILLYNACKGILRVKSARSELEQELMNDAFESGKKLNQIETTFSPDTRPEMQDYKYAPEGQSFDINPEDDAEAKAATNRFRRRALTLAGGGAGVAGGLYFTRNANPYARVAAATALGGLGAYGAHKLGNIIFAD